MDLQRQLSDLPSVRAKKNKEERAKDRGRKKKGSAKRERERERSDRSRRLNANQPLLWRQLSRDYEKTLYR